MPFSQFIERATLDLDFGDLVGQVNGAITAPAATTTSIVVKGSAGGAAMDITAASGQVFLLATPAAAIGGATAPNGYSNIDIVTATTGSTTTSLAIVSQTIGKSRAVGDAIFLLGPQGALTPAVFNNTWYIGLSTQAVAGATQANVLTGEPTATGGYARIAAINNTANLTASTGVNPATKASGAIFSFPASTAGWSTGATNLIQVFLADSPTLAGGNVFGFGALTTPQAVNAAGITLSFAVGALTITLS